MQLRVFVPSSEVFDVLLSDLPEETTDEDEGYEGGDRARRNGARSARSVRILGLKK